MRTGQRLAVIISLAIVIIITGCTQPEEEEEKMNNKLKGALLGFSGLYNGANGALMESPMSGNLITIDTFVPGASEGNAYFSEVPYGEQVLVGNFVWSNWVFTYTDFTDDDYTVNGLFSNSRTGTESGITTDIDIVASASMVDRTLDINVVIDNTSGEVTGGTIVFDGKEYDALDYAGYLQLETY